MVRIVTPLARRRPAPIRRRPAPIGPLGCVRPQNVYGWEMVAGSAGLTRVCV